MCFCSTTSILIHYALLINITDKSFFLFYVFPMTTTTRKLKCSFVHFISIEGKNRTLFFLFFFFFLIRKFLFNCYISFCWFCYLIPMNFNQLLDWSIVIEIELASLDRNEKSFFQLILTLQIWLKIDWVRTFQCETFNIRSVILKIDVLTFVFLFLKNWWSIVINI